MNFPERMYQIAKLEIEYSVRIRYYQGHLFGKTFFETTNSKMRFRFEAHIVK